MSNLSTAYLGLGANLGDPVQQLIDARTEIYSLPGSLGGRCSSFYLSSPVGYDAQPDFINCVIELSTQLTAIELLDALQAIELRLGRQRVATNQNAPRLIDIDLLLFGNDVIASERLCVPHPRMHLRAFVLEPLLELTELSQYRAALNDGEFSGQLLHRLRIG